MRHLNNTAKLNRTSSHRRCMVANMLKSLIVHGSVQTTVPKAKLLRRFADKMITMAKKNTLAMRRKAIAELMIRFNTLTDKEERAARKGDHSAYNDDRNVINILFGDLAQRFANRNGGYTRIVRTKRRVGDNAEMCLLEYLEA